MADRLKNRKRISTTLDLKTLQNLKDYSDKSMIPISKIIDIAVQEYIKKNNTWNPLINFHTKKDPRVIWGLSFNISYTKVMLFWCIEQWRSLLPVSFLLALDYANSNSTDE